MDSKPPRPQAEQDQSSNRWIFFALAGISLAVVLAYIWRPWRPDMVARSSYEQLLLNPEDRHGLLYGLLSGNKTVKLGILHSRTGEMAISERSMVDAELMAVDEINQNGGLLGGKVEVVIRDGQSDPMVFAKEAERLISKDKVCTIIGCYTTASRLAVRKVVEKHNHLLIYPKSYDGFELSTNIVYTGAAPNQQLMPAFQWSFDNLGGRFFFVGSDNPGGDEIDMSDIVHDEVRALGGTLVGEDYVSFRGANLPGTMARIVSEIQTNRTQVIISAVEGDANIAFFSALRAAGVTNPVVSISLGEDELRKFPSSEAAGNFAAASYFQSLDRPENTEFVARFKHRYGPDRVTSDAIETAYFSVLLWAQAVMERGSDRVKDIRRNLLAQSLDAPEGVVSIDSETHYTWRSFSIGRIQTNGQFEVVWTARKPIRPWPYPNRRSRGDWENLRELRRTAAEDYFMPGVGEDER